MSKKGTKKVSFTALRTVKKPVKVEFYTKRGKKVVFSATQKLKKPVKVEFYTKVKRRHKKK